MMFFNWSPGDMRATVERISRLHFAGNLRLDVRSERETKRGWRVSAVLRVNSSRGPGARRSHSGRRTVAATWEAHRLVMVELFDLNPYQGRIQSMLADYRSRADFLVKFSRTADHNAGSMMQPARFGDL